MGCAHEVKPGAFRPRSLPVNVYLPHQDVSNDSVFDPLSVSTTHRPRIVLTSPEHPPISGLVEATVTFDETKQRGVDVQVRGAVGMDLKPGELEELSRRGGTFGIPGRIWQRSMSSSH